MGKHQDAPARPSDPPPNVPTPNNTPIPGGGSWHWDANIPGWVENTPTQTNAATQE